MRPERSQRRKAIKREEQKLTRRAQLVSRTWRDAPFRILFRWILVLSAASLAILLAVAYLSPLFQVRAVSVVGAQRVPEQQIVDSLGPLLGANLLQISDDAVAKLLQAHPLIESFAVQAVPPNELRVKVRERQPVLLLTDGKDEVLVDVSGMAIPVLVESQDYEALPRLSVSDVSEPGAAFSAAVTALLEFPTELFHKVAALEVSTGKSVTLQLRDPAIRVIWGGPEEAELKYEVLMSLLANQTDQNIEIDVTAPRTPVVRFLDF